MVNDEARDRRALSDPDPRVQFQLGSMLRQVYGTVITEPVPDRFSALLNQLAHSPDGGADSVPSSSASVPEVSKSHVVTEAPVGSPGERS